MKTRHAARSDCHSSEAAIREKAHEIYMRSGWVHGRDLDNWLEAKAALLAHPLDEASRVRARPHPPTRTSHSVARGDF
jgi:hypothetical protein